MLTRGVPSPGSGALPPHGLLGATEPPPVGREVPKLAPGVTPRSAASGGGRGARGPRVLASWVGVAVSRSQERWRLRPLADSTASCSRQPSRSEGDGPAGLGIAAIAPSRCPHSRGSGNEVAGTLRTVGCRIGRRRARGLALPPWTARSRAPSGPRRPTLCSPRVALSARYCPDATARSPSPCDQSPSPGLAPSLRRRTGGASPRRAIVRIR